MRRSSNNPLREIVPPNRPFRPHNGATHRESAPRLGLDDSSSFHLRQPTPGTTPFDSGATASAVALNISSSPMEAAPYPTHEWDNAKTESPIRLSSKSEVAGLNYVKSIGSIDADEFEGHFDNFERGALEAAMAALEDIKEPVYKRMDGLENHPERADQQSLSKDGAEDRWNSCKTNHSSYYFFQSLCLIVFGPIWRASMKYVLTVLHHSLFTFQPKRCRWD